MEIIKFAHNRTFLVLCSCFSTRFDATAVFLFQLAFLEYKQLFDSILISLIKKVFVQRRKRTLHVGTIGFLDGKKKNGLFLSKLSLVLYRLVQWVYLFLRDGEGKKEEKNNNIIINCIIEPRADN